MNLCKLFILLAGILVLSGCNLVGKLKDGLAQSNAAAEQIAKDVGSKPAIGFNYHNGKLMNVTVTFSTATTKPVAEIEAAVRKAVVDAFKTEPEKITILYALPKSTA